METDSFQPVSTDRIIRFHSLDRLANSFPYKIRAPNSDAASSTASSAVRLP